MVVGLVAASLSVSACASSGSDAGPDDEVSASDVASSDAETDDVAPSDSRSASQAGPEDSSNGDDGPRVSPSARYTYPPPPDAPTADVEDAEAADAIDRIVRGIMNVQELDGPSVEDLAAAGDARHAWMVADFLRFFGGDDAVLLVDTFQTLTGTPIDDDPELLRNPWSSITNHMIAWDTPDYPGYREDKGALFTQIDDRWAPFFDDADADIDWRHLSWGGVLIDDRPLDDTEPCTRGCIAALDDPPTTDASGGDWYPDERTVFGIVVDGDALAIPLNIAEVHEMFNLSVGDRRLAIPYCTLCGSAQAYFTDQPDGAPVAGADSVPVVRTSGLLSRSNKVMYDVSTFSVFDTFTGAAVSGPLHDADVVLEETTVVRSTWAQWKDEHPDTRIVAEDGGIGRSYDLDPLGGRDDDGPIFPIGDVDPRFGAQEFVVGVLVDDGTAVAFPSEEATAALAAGDPVELDGVELRESGDGLVAVDAETGDSFVAHEAFWFAWSQFHPDTQLWER